MSLKKQGTKKAGAFNDSMPGDIMLRNAMTQEEYYEKPRPSLFNVIKKLKEKNGEPLNRLCYIAKLQDNFRGDAEKEFTKWTTETINNDEENEFKPQGTNEIRYGGFAVVMGNWMVHMFEAEQPLMGRYIRALNNKVHSKDSYYSNAWVVHYTEDVPQ